MEAFDSVRAVGAAATVSLDAEVDPSDVFSVLDEHGTETEQHSDRIETTLVIEADGGAPPEITHSGRSSERVALVNSTAGSAQREMAIAVEIVCRDAAPVINLVSYDGLNLQPVMELGEQIAAALPGAAALGVSGHHRVRTHPALNDVQTLAHLLGGEAADGTVTVPAGNTDWLLADSGHACRFNLHIIAGGTAGQAAPDVSTAVHALNQRLADAMPTLEQVNSDLLTAVLSPVAARADQYSNGQMMFRHLLDGTIETDGACVPLTTSENPSLASLLMHLSRSSVRYAHDVLPAQHRLVMMNDVASLSGALGSRLAAEFDTTPETDTLFTANDEQRLTEIVQKLGTSHKLAQRYADRTLPTPATGETWEVRCPDSGARVLVEVTGRMEYNIPYAHDSLWKGTVIALTSPPDDTHASTPTAGDTVLLDPKTMADQPANTSSVAATSSS